MEILGYSAECMISSAIAQDKRIKKYVLSRDLLYPAMNTAYLKKKTQIALSYLKEEYGIPTLTRGLRRTSFSWEDVPTQTILDRVFGVDFSLNILGYKIAIDVTTNQTKIKEKKEKLWKVIQVLPYDYSLVIIVRKLEVSNLFSYLKKEKDKGIIII